MTNLAPRRMLRKGKIGAACGIHSQSIRVFAAGGRMHNIVTAIMALLLLWCGTATAQDSVHFKSLDGTTELDGYLYRPAGESGRPKPGLTYHRLGVRSHERVLPGIRVEIAVGALRRAEGYVDVKGARRLLGYHQRSVSQAGNGGT